MGYENRGKDVKTVGVHTCTSTIISFGSVNMYRVHPTKRGPDILSSMSRMATLMGSLIVSPYY